MCGLSLWHEGHHAVSGVVGACDPCRRRRGLGLIWLVADTLNAFMAIPEPDRASIVVACVFALTREYFARKPSGTEVAAE